MPFQIIRGDITTLPVDAIVNAADPTLLGGGGVDGAIHRAAGPMLVKACQFRYPEGCKTGEAKITPAYRLPCKKVIHTVGPIWHGGNQGEKEQLISCYQKSLELATAYDCHSVAFPLISSGAYRYPKEEALQVAVDTITAFLQDHDLDVYLVIFQKSDYQISSKLAEAVSSYWKETCSGEVDLRRDEEESLLDYLAGKLESLYLKMPESMEEEPQEAEGMICEFEMAPIVSPKADDRAKRIASLEQKIDQLTHVRSPKPEIIQSEKPVSACLAKVEAADFSDLEESFSSMVLRKIDEKGMTDPQCYKKANLDRKLFSKIRSHEDYQPSRATALALGIALELPLSELQELLAKAGYTLSHARRADVIVEYFVKKGIYDIYKINQVLFDFEEPTI